MFVQASLEKLSELPEAELTKLRELLQRAVAHPERYHVYLGTDKGERLDLTPQLAGFLLAASVALARALQEEATTEEATASEKDLSVDEAAEILNVPRPYLTRLLNRGEIPYHTAGKRRRINLRDLLAYKQKRDAERRQALDELTRVSQEVGLYD